MAGAAAEFENVLWGELGWEIIENGPEHFVVARHAAADLVRILGGDGVEELAGVGWHFGLIRRELGGGECVLGYAP